MIEIIIVFAVAGLIILWVFGIKPELDNLHNEKTCKDHYKTKG